MAMPTRNGSKDFDATETDPESQTARALRLAQAAEAAAGKVRTQLDEIARIMSSLVKINAVFEAVADRLSNVTVKASADITLGVAPRVVLVSFVEQLADLARRTSDGTREIRKELRTYAMNFGVTGLAVRQIDTATKGLQVVLEQIAEAESGSTPSVRVIEIETRVPPSPQMTVAALAKAVAAGGWIADPPKSGGYKN